MLDHSKRFGRFSSSKIGALTTLGRDKVSLGAPALTYISKVRKELDFGRTLENTKEARPLQWGKLCETRLFQMLGTEYEDMHDNTIQHPTCEYWCGTPDAIKHTESGIVCVEMKSPFTLDSFHDLVVPYQRGGIDEVRDIHSEGETYYWQCVSNAVLLGTTKAELIVYLPYFSEIDEIKIEGGNFGFQWINFALDGELPYLLDDGKFKNINIMPFEIPQNDFDRLEYSVNKAVKLLK